jgi:DnaK suppressor protein
MIDTTIYKQKLEEHLKEIETELSTIGIHNPRSDDWEAVVDKENNKEADQNSESDMAEDLDEREGTLTALEIEYRNIKRALQKIADGVYGICEISGDPIEEARLQIKPDARTSIAHMGEEDKLPL